MILAAKIPGPRMRIRSVLMEFLYGATFDAVRLARRSSRVPPQPHERLTLHAIRPDATLFTRNDEVQAPWPECDPILQARSELPGRLPTYTAGPQGPPEANAILRPGDAWRPI